MANFNFNKVMLGGRLTADPELKQTPNGIPVATIRMAVNRRFASKESPQQQQDADFFNVTAWRATAEFVARYFKKGSSIFVVGTIQNRTWTDQQGQKRYVTDIVADEVQFVDSRGEGGNSGYGAQSFGAPQSQPAYTPDAYTAAPSYASQPNEAPSFEEIPTDDDLPF
jgi:single-strand DNA-binding protein